ncbi:hypothetical protein F5Y08DRAFT_353014 [Xylaria arbuscula]|nr:hypothetical protein F5Y08DRAFT_353014 [Xylaria arbuscula]
MEADQAGRQLPLERRFYRKMLSWTQFVRQKLVLLFDLPINALLSPEKTHARDTGFGVSAPNAYRFIDVIRHDWAMVLTFVCIMSLVSQILYILIEPESVFDLEYSLAILFLFYVVGVLVVIYQAIRDMDHPTRIQLILPEIHPPKELCGICQEELPIQEMCTLHCYTPEGGNPVRHSFCEPCIVETFRARQRRNLPEFTCPICRQVPTGYDRHYGPPNPGVLDNSRLMWYINSLFARRLLITLANPVRRPWYGVISGDPRTVNTRYYVELVPRVLLNHFLCLTALLFYIRIADFTLVSVVDFELWAAVVFIAIAAFLNKCSEVVHDRYSAMVRDNRDVCVAMAIQNLATFIHYVIDPLRPQADFDDDDADEDSDDGLGDLVFSDDGLSDDGVPDLVFSDDGFSDDGFSNDGLSIDGLSDNGLSDGGFSGEGERDQQGQQDQQDQPEFQQVQDELQQVRQEFEQVQQEFQAFQQNLQDQQDQQDRQDEQRDPNGPFIQGFWQAATVCRQSALLLYRASIKIFWRVGCFSLFDLIRYVGWRISIFTLVLAIYQLVMLLFFELESSLVVPSMNN